MIAVALLVLGASSAFLFVYGINLLHLSWRALRLPERRSSPSPRGEAAETVVVQLPIYNERYVAERAIDAACGLDWPRERLEVQVLDDSDDDTREIVARAVARWRQKGVRVRQVRRESRSGYKAGALAHGLTLTSAPLVAVFDADFVPPPDFLRRMVPALAEPDVAFVQARWGHLNETFSLFTYLQSLMTDFHFLVEQAVRPVRGYPTNFTGSAGVWRRAAIDAVGGWSASTLTEDLDLSYRAQLGGWRARYLEDVVVPQELPVSVNAYRGQQSRWATGSFQCARRLLGPLVRSRLRPAAKFEGAMHLLGYLAPVAMLAQIACYPLLLVARAQGQTLPPVGIPVVASLLSLAPTAGMAVAQFRRGRRWWEHLHGLLGWTVLGAGTSLTVIASLGRALRGGGEFVRTPKYRVEREGQEWRSKAYFQPLDARAAVEVVCGVAAGALALESARFGQWLLAVYAGCFGAGFLYLSLTGLVQGLRGFRYEELALQLRVLARRLQPCALVAFAGLGMLALVRIPDPFEDSYQHWLIAANLATTGHLRDPLFQMQDTWLPAYQVLAALVLRALGTWQLAALRVVNVGLGLLTLGLVYRMAGSRRRGLVAVFLLASNPIFLLTATTAVAEPLLVAGLWAAAAAAGEGRSKLAAALAVLACLTGIKAWLWLGCLAAVLGAGWVLRHRRSPRLAWAAPRLAAVAPALALAVALQAGFGFASHSVTRAAAEVGSATARGDLAAAPLARTASFVGYFALASLPLAMAAPAGLWMGRRDPEEATARALALASLLYLGIVTALILAGVYSGSHRYYYPALPGLALAAAGAVERMRGPLALLPLGAAVALTAAYVPVFNGLAADNRGLRLAGSQAAELPGALLTDSPAAAYWSHKPPDAIYGSRALPRNPASAVGWLRSHGVGGLVLEDIDYYHASAVLPGLVRGRQAPPFVYLGDQAAYAVPGGKRVHVYELGPVAPVTVAPGVEAAVELGHQPAAGKTAPLAKGLVLREGGRDLAGEGMGFGVPIVRYADGWHYPGSAATSDLSNHGPGVWRKTYQLDMVGGDSRHAYRFQAAPSVGTVEVTYRVARGRVAVQVRPLWLRAGAQQVVVLNEQSAAFDDLADASATRVGPAFANWTPVSGSWARLRSANLGVEWALTAAGRSTLEAGREQAPPDFDWSGLDYVFGPSFAGVDYQISIRRAR
jgi:cellulose synthase/poly-beta-1,6-N-acetylglucosamine synthase-like glycosyltransferase